MKRLSALLSAIALLTGIFTPVTAANLPEPLFYDVFDGYVTHQKPTQAAPRLHRPDRLRRTFRCRLRSGKGRHGSRQHGSYLRCGLALPRHCCRCFLRHAVETFEKAPSHRFHRHLCHTRHHLPAVNKKKPPCGNIHRAVSCFLITPRRRRPRRRSDPENTRCRSWGT